jgi:hypothetical protein
MREVRDAIAEILEKTTLETVCREVGHAVEKQKAETPPHACAVDSLETLAARPKLRDPVRRPSFSFPAALLCKIHKVADRFNGH